MIQLHASSRSPASPRAPRRRLACVWHFAFAALLGLAAARAETSKEYQVKAAFLYNFTKFVEWPADRLPSPESPIVIAVLGHNPFGPELEKILRGRSIDGHPLRLLPLAFPLPAGSAPPVFHVLFVPAGEETLFRDALPLATRNSALSVGESDAFTSLGGIINFIVVDEKVRFEIDREAAERLQLKISAQLQKLATPSRRRNAGASR